MEALTLLAEGVAFVSTLVLSPMLDETKKKLVTKVGEQLATGILGQGNKVLALIKSKFPDKGSKLDKAAEKPQDYIEADIIKDITEVANSDDEIKQAIADLGKMIQENSEAKQIIENWKGINIKGGVNTIQNNTLTIN
ncbi:hypothetical protein VB691_04985 [Crocosphaera sp. XPORK-15E]|nr:hypothetical protein [Crocosphaera sp. XPORK-15E]